MICLIIISFVKPKSKDEGQTNKALPHQSLGSVKMGLQSGSIPGRSIIKTLSVKRQKKI